MRACSGFRVYRVLGFRVQGGLGLWGFEHSVLLSILPAAVIGTVYNVTERPPTVAEGLTSSNLASNLTRMVCSSSSEAALSGCDAAVLLRACTM